MLSRRRAVAGLPAAVPVRHRGPESPDDARLECGGLVVLSAWSKEWSGACFALPNANQRGRRSRARLVALTKASAADALVSGDDDILAVEPDQVGVDVVTPRQLIDRLD
jgi:hypothetical protein